MIWGPTQRRFPMHTTKSSRSFDAENPEATARPSSCPWKSSPAPHSSAGSPTQDSNCVLAPRSRVASWILDSNPDHVTNHRSKTAVPLYRQATRASIRNPERFGWNPERFGLNSSKIQRSPEIQNPSFKIQRSRRPWSNPKHGGGIQAHALSDPGVGMCDGFEPQITGLALNRPSDSRSLNPAGNSQLESKCSGIRKKTLDFSNYLKFQRLEIQLDPMIVHEC